MIVNSWKKAPHMAKMLLLSKVPYIYIKVYECVETPWDNHTFIGEYHLLKRHLNTI